MESKSMEKVNLWKDASYKTQTNWFKFISAQRSPQNAITRCSTTVNCWFAAPH